MAFLCGAARVPITPEVGTYLYGYQPEYASTSVHDELNVTALAFGNGSGTLLWFIATVGDIATSLCNEVRELASHKFGLPKSHVLLSATHTHSAPCVSDLDGWGGINRPYVDGVFLPAIERSGKEALDLMVDAEIARAIGYSFVGVNRRAYNEEGVMDFGQTPDAPFDPQMTLFAIRDAKTKAGIVNLIHYGCHGTAAGMNPEITRDWSGVMIDRLEAESGVLSVFANGTVGDAGPRLSNGKTVGNIKLVEELGAIAADDCCRIYRTLGDYAPVELKIKPGVLHLPCQPYPTLDEIDAILSEYGDPERLINADRLRYSHYADLKELLKDGPRPTPPDSEYETTVFFLGDAAFLPVPFELFAEIGLQLRRESGLTDTLCLSVTNGYEGYLPTEDQLPLGGYEVTVFRCGVLNPLSDQTDRNLINEFLRIIREGAV